MAENREKNGREDDQYIHESFPVRKKFAKQSIQWGVMIFLVPTLISIGWLPPITSADMRKHEEHHDKDFKRLETLLHKHESMDRHPGAPSKKEYEREVTHLEESLKEHQKIITAVQVDIAKLKSDTEHIKAGIGEIKNLLRNR